MKKQAVRESRYEGTFTEYMVKQLNGDAGRKQ